MFDFFEKYFCIISKAGALGGRNREALCSQQAEPPCNAIDKSTQLQHGHFIKHAMMASSTGWADGQLPNTGTSSKSVS